MINDSIQVNLSGGLDIPIPRMVKVNVEFDNAKVDNISDAVANELQKPAIRQKVSAGMTIALGCGSRGIANISECTKAVVDQLKAMGANVFIFPAMGSHGAATVEGQMEVLASYGITEQAMGCAIRATMDTIEVGKLDNGCPLHVDAYAAEADGIVLINRIKPHTTFRAPIESGIVKMMTIGMGKIRGATALHTYGMHSFGELLPAAATQIMKKVPFLFGVALVENGYEETAILEAIPAETLLERETELQARAKALMGRLHFDQVDVLVIDEMGKNISGAGFDPNITGRNNRNVEWSGLDVSKIVVLGLTEETHGNAAGVGLADVTTMRLYKELDIGATYANVITATYLDGGVIPIIMNTDQDAIRLAIKTTINVKPLECRVVRIKNTLELAEIMVSETMINDVEQHEHMTTMGEMGAWQFDESGSTVPMM